MSRRGISDVAVIEPPARMRRVFDQLLQFYLHDFSEFAPLGSQYGEVGADGLFRYTTDLGLYWQEAGRVPLLIHADGAIAGFTLLNQWSALDRPLDRGVAEFFVLRKYRRADVGTRAAHAVFRRYAGRWEVPVAAYNPNALAFWRSAAGRMRDVHVTEYAGDGQRWSGTVLCFETIAT